MRFTNKRIVLLLLVVFVAFGTFVIAQKENSKDEKVVENFSVNDVPADDGTGLVLSWKPLHRSNRIIEYRIYRGIDKDRLFFHGSIPVNVKTGVAADTMFYYDSSWTEFVDIKSPGKLKKERQQSEDSPLYRKIPRDVKVASELSGKFNILSVIEKKNFYYRSTKSWSSDPADSSVYAGLHMRQQTLLGKLKPGEEYFYTVVAVDERNKYHQFAPISSAKPVDNTPEAATELHTVFLEDSGKLHAEWQYPLFTDDLYGWTLLMTPSMDKADWNAKRISGDVSSVQTKPVAMGQVQSIGNDSAINYTILDVKELEKQGISSEQIKNAGFTLELMDYSQFKSYSNLSNPRLTTTASLPVKPAFRVEDKPNDKGDRLTVVWDHPIAFINQTTMVSESSRKLRLNYQLNKTETQDVLNIYFKFFKLGGKEAFATVNEFYQDDKIFLTIPKDYDYKKGFDVHITLKTKPALSDDYVLQQKLVWNDQMMTLMPDKSLFRNGVDVSKIGNFVYRKRVNTPFYTGLKKSTSLDNNLDVTIPYEASIYKLINAFNYVEKDSLITVTGGKRFAKALEKGMSRTPLLLMSADIDLIYDRENKRTINTKIYRDEAVKELDLKVSETDKKLKELADQLKQLESGNQDPATMTQIAALKAQIEGAEKAKAALNNEHLLKANAISSDRSRMSFIAKTREYDKRQQSFKLVATDGKGLFTESDEELDTDKNHLYNFPIANWFDRNKFVTLFASLIFAAIVFSFISMSKRGKDLYIRPIAGLSEIDNAIGRATEMGRPILYCPGGGSLSDVATLASLGILGLVAKKAAEYDTKLIVPCYDFMVMPIAQEIVRDAHYEVGRPDTYDKNNIFFLTNAQFAYVAGVNGIMVRERMATNFFMGFFAAEALLMTETGNSVGAVQIAGTDAITQIPFFITTCDYTLIGEELYAASAYLNREPMLLGTLKGQDYYKFLILAFVLVGALLSTMQITQLIRIFPVK